MESKWQVYEFLDAFTICVFFLWAVHAFKRYLHKTEHL